MNNQNEHSIVKRYISRIISQIVTILLEFLTVGVVPRALGPAGYGSFEYLFQFYNGIISFIDSGTSNAFYTKLSQRQKETKLISFYFQFIIVIFFVIGLFTLSAHIFGFFPKIFPELKPEYVYLGLFFAFFMFFYQISIKMMDAYGLTVYLEIIKVIMKLCFVILIFAFFFSNILNLVTYYISHYFNICISSIIIFFLLVKFREIFSIKEWKLSIYNYKQYGKEFFDYCHPILIYSFVSMIALLFERWILQSVGGSTQQGFFSVAYKIGAIIFIFSKSFTSILFREFSIAFGKKDIKKMAKLFRRFVPLLYTITSFFAVFVMFKASIIIFIIGEEQYKDAIIPIKIMALYPVHQTFGQLCGIIFFATGQTKLYRNIGFINIPLGIIVVYFLLAPKEYFGLGLGALGLSIKMLVVQFIGANIFLYYNCKILKIKYRNYFFYQLIAITTLLIIAFCTTFLIDNFISNRILNFLISGFLYSIIVLFSLMKFPLIFGLKKDDPQIIKETIFKYINKIKKK